MILITGISGLVGSYLAQKMVEAGYLVRGLINTTPPEHLIPSDTVKKIDWVQGNILDIGSIQEAMKGVTCVVHCAAIISFSPKRQLEMYKTNVEGTANMVNAALDFKVSKFIHISSVAALGRKEGKTEIDENAKWEDSNLNSGYAKSKYLSELEVWRAAEEGLPIAIVNPSIILGSGDPDKGSTKLFDYVWKETPFYVEGKMNYVDVRDVVDALLILVKQNIINERFILNGGTTSYRNFFQLVAQKLGKSAPRYKASPWMLAIAWRLAALVSLFTKKEPLLSKETAQISKSHFLYLNDKSIQQLGIKYRSLEETITSVCEKFRKV